MLKKYHDVPVLSLNVLGYLFVMRKEEVIDLMIIMGFDKTRLSYDFDRIKFEPYIFYDFTNTLPFNFFGSHLSKLQENSQETE